MQYNNICIFMLAEMGSMRLTILFIKAITTITSGYAMKNYGQNYIINSNDTSSSTENHDSLEVTEINSISLFFFCY